MAFICEGTIVKTQDNVSGVVVSTNHKTRSAIIHKDAGGYVICPIGMVQVISYKGV